MLKSIPLWAEIATPIVGLNKNGTIYWINKEARSKLPFFLNHSETPIWEDMSWTATEAMKIEDLIMNEASNTLEINITDLFGFQEKTIWKKVWHSSADNPNILLHILISSDKEHLKNKYQSLVNLVDEFQNILPIGMISFNRDEVITGLTRKALQILYPVPLRRNHSLKEFDSILGNEWHDIIKSEDLYGNRKIITPGGKNLNITFSKHDEQIICFIDDLTQQFYYDEKLKELSDLKDFAELVLSAARQINNILGVVSARAQYLEKHPGDQEKVKQTIDIIIKKTEENSVLIKNIQNYANLKLAHKFLNFDIIEYIKNIVKNEQYLWHSTQKRIHLSLRFKVERAVISGNPDEIMELIRILLKNAKDSIISQGEIILTVREELNQIILEVSDNGIGIPKENHTKIFQAFFTTKQSPAKGTGLNIAMGIALRHQARINFESEPGKGTDFQVIFPKKPIMDSYQEKLSFQA